MTLMEHVSSTSVAVPTTAMTPGVEKYFPGERSPILRQVAKTYYLAMMGKQLSTPTPRDKPLYRSRREASYKVLLVGNGPTHGWGVTTHGLALTGQLGQAVSRRTGYGADVDYVGEELMNASTTLDFLGDRDVTAYDLVVVVLSMNDAVRLTPVGEWEHDVTTALDYLREARRPGTPLVVVGIQSVNSAFGYHNVVGALGQRHADRLNGRMLAAVEARGDTFLPLGEPYLEPGFGGIKSGATYARWAEEITAGLIELLPSEPPSTPELVEAVWERPGLEKAMGFDGVDRAEKLREIVSRAKKALHAPIAYVSVVDHEQQYMPTAVGSMAAALPVDLSYCKYTVRQDDPVIVENAMKDERFAGNGYVDAVNLPFYAGKSLKAEDGDVIGTFCIMGPLPKSGKRVDMEKFEAFAAEAEAALREIEVAED